ncbi:MAG: DUF3303 family protein [Promethearchaeota archaeon]
MLFGVHLTLTPDKLAEVVQLYKKDGFTCPEGVRIVKEYIWSLKFLVILVEAGQQEAVLTFMKQFAGYTSDWEVGIVTTLQDFATL